MSLSSENDIGDPFDSRPTVLERNESRGRNAGSCGRHLAYNVRPCKELPVKRPQPAPFAMFIRIELVPLRVRTVATLRAPDPWNGGRSTDFNLEAYRMVPK